MDIVTAWKVSRVYSTFAIECYLSKVGKMTFQWQSIWIIFSAKIHFLPEIILTTAILVEHWSKIQAKLKNSRTYSQTNDLKRQLTRFSWHYQCRRHKSTKTIRKKETVAQWTELLPRKAKQLPTVSSTVTIRQTWDENLPQLCSTSLYEKIVRRNHLYSF